MILIKIRTKLNYWLQNTAEFSTGAGRFGWTPFSYFNNYLLLV
tara:strand:- start:158 stop:286 length:129 start_codon:yes stop_codon:yes gene_type:complete